MSAQHVVSSMRDHHIVALVRSTELPAFHDYTYGASNPELRPDVPEGE